MKFGLYIYGGNPSEFQASDADRYRSALEQAGLAETLGFDFLWVAEHHFDPLTTPNPFILCAAIAARTERIRVGTSIAIAPLHHPAMLAENAAMLDALSNGRFDLGLGVGYEPREFKTFGVSLRERGARTDEALTVIKGLWSQHEYSFQGRYYDLDRVTLHPRPVQPDPPLWVAVDKKPVDGIIPPALERAARHGCHLSGPTDPDMLRLYDEALLANGHEPRTRHRSCLRPGFVGETQTQAWQDYAPHVLIQLQDYLQAYSGTGIHQSTNSSAPSADDLPALAADGKIDFLGKPFVVGTPDEVAAAIEEQRKAGITHFILWMHIGGIDPRKAERSMRLFADEVLPRFQ